MVNSQISDKVQTVIGMVKPEDLSVVYHFETKLTIFSTVQI